MGPIQITLLILGVSLVVAVAAFLAGTIYRKKVAEREIGSAEEEATRIINEAIRGGESKKKEMLLEAPSTKRKSKSAAASFPSRNAACSKRKNPWIRKWTPTSGKRTT